MPSLTQAIQFKLRRGTQEEHETFTGALAEVTADTTRWVPIVHDGTTPGGFPLCPLFHTHDAADLTWAKEMAYIDDAPKDSKFYSRYRGSWEVTSWEQDVIDIDALIANVTEKLDILGEHTHRSFQIVDDDGLPIAFSDMAFEDDAPADDEDYIRQFNPNTMKCDWSLPAEEDKTNIQTRLDIAEAFLGNIDEHNHTVSDIEQSKGMMAENDAPEDGRVYIRRFGEWVTTDSVEYFNDMRDVSTPYAGKENYIIKVNREETALEYIPPINIKHPVLQFLEQNYYEYADKKPELNRIVDAKPYRHPDVTIGNWLGSCLGQDGKIYYAPYLDTAILIYDPRNDTFERVEVNAIAGIHNYFGCTAAANGKIYFAPSSHNNIQYRTMLLEYDIFSKKVEYYYLDYWNENIADVHSGVIYGNDGLVYLGARGGSKYKSFNPITKEVLTYSGPTATYGLTQDINSHYIYTSPYGNTNCYRLDPRMKQTLTISGFNTGNIIGIQGLDENIYFNKQLLNTQTFTPEELSFRSEVGSSVSMCAAPDGRIYYFDDQLVRGINTIKSEIDFTIPHWLGEAPDNVTIGADSKIYLMSETSKMAVLELDMPPLPRHIRNSSVFQGI